MSPLSTSSGLTPSFYSLKCILYLTYFGLISNNKRRCTSLFSVLGKEGRTVKNLDFLNYTSNGMKWRPSVKFSLKGKAWICKPSSKIKSFLHLKAVYNNDRSLTFYDTEIGIIITTYLEFSLLSLRSLYNIQTCWNIL